MRIEPIIEVPLNVHLDLVEQAVTEGARRNVAMSHIIRKVRTDRRLVEQRDTAEARYERLREAVDAAGYGHVLELFDDAEWDRC